MLETSMIIKTLVSRFGLICTNFDRFLFVFQRRAVVGKNHWCKLFSRLSNRVPQSSKVVCSSGQRKQTSNLTLKLIISLYSTAKCKKKFTPHRKLHRWNFFPLIPAVLSSLGHTMENEILFYIIQSIKDLSKMVLKLLHSPLYATMLMR